MNKLKKLPVIWAVALTAACDAVQVLDPGDVNEPRDLQAVYSWELEGWNEGDVIGYSVVRLSWALPSRFNGEVFRVYARRGSGPYSLIATVTSCSDGLCRYDDTNIASGNSYDYYIATFDERAGNELATSNAIRVNVPSQTNVSVPTAPTAISLDRGVYLRWQGASGIERYFIVVQTEDGSSYQIGETDGETFFDGRVENGQRYRYYLAAMNQHGHVSSLSQPANAYPRPDYHADIVYAYGDRPAQSGFRFVESETQDPIVSGDSPSAHWRLEEVGGELRIRPLGGATITAGVFTTQLSCGPGSDADCEDVRVAPAPNAFGSAAVPVGTGYTYVLRVTGTDNATHYAKLRVQGASVDANGDRLIVFDWAYQLRANEPTLNRQF